MPRALLRVNVFALELAEWSIRRGSSLVLLVQPFEGLKVPHGRGAGAKAEIRAGEDADDPRARRLAAAVDWLVIALGPA